MQVQSSPTTEESAATGTKGGSRASPEETMVVSERGILLHSEKSIPHSRDRTTTASTHSKLAMAVAEESMIAVKIVPPGRKAGILAEEEAGMKELPKPCSSPPIMSHMTGKARTKAAIPDRPGSKPASARTPTTGKVRATRAGEVGSLRAQGNRGSSLSRVAAERRGIQAAVTGMAPSVVRRIHSKERSPPDASLPTTEKIVHPETSKLVTLGGVTTLTGIGIFSGVAKDSMEKGETEAPGETPKGRKAGAHRPKEEILVGEILMLPRKGHQGFSSMSLR